MSATALPEEDCPDVGWSYLAKVAQQSDDNEQFYIDRRTLNGLLVGEIILDEMAKAGVHEWCDFESCMEAVAKRLKNGDEE